MTVMGRSRTFLHIISISLLLLHYCVPFGGGVCDSGRCRATVAPSHKVVKQRIKRDHNFRQRRSSAHPPSPVKASLTFTHNTDNIVQHNVSGGRSRGPSPAACGSLGAQVPQKLH